jgi:hypothetical protein
MGRFSSSRLKAFFEAGGTRLIAGEGDQVGGFLHHHSAPISVVIADSTFRHQPPLLNPLFRR